MNNLHNIMLENFIIENIESFSCEIKQKLNEIYIILQQEKQHPQYNDGVKNVSIQLMMEYLTKAIIPPVKGKRTTSVTIRNKKFKRRVVALDDEYKAIAEHLNNHVDDYWELLGTYSQNALMHLVNENAIYTGLYPLYEYAKHTEEERKMANIAMDVMFHDVLTEIIKTDNYIRNYATS